MITGVELTLAILPLIISAAENQKTFFEKGKALASNKEKNEQQLDFFYELYDELSLLSSNLSGLIISLPSLRGAEKGSPFVVNPQQLTSGVIDDELDAALGTRKEPFKSILQRLLTSLEAIVSDKSLELAEHDVPLPDAMFAKLETFKLAMAEKKTHWDMSQRLRDVSLRLRFTANGKSRGRALHKIRKGNKNLERLLHKSSVFEDRLPAPKSSTPPTRSRRLSGALYKKVAGKWPSSCQCHRQHEARLILWNCCSSNRHSESDNSLDMLLSIADFNQDRAAWQESTWLVSSQHNSLHPHQRGVRFAVESQPSSRPSTPNSPGRDIDSEDLCNLISQAHHKGISLHLLFENGRLWQTKSKTRNLRLQRQNDIPLKELLQSQRPVMNLREKRILAVVLAHAALHCSDSPWLCKDWSSEHVTFFHNDTLTGPDLRRPCLAVDFENRLFDEIEDVNPDKLHSYPALLSLGILLLEINICQTIESKWSEDDLIEGQPNENTNLTTAIRLLDALDGEIYEDYRRAIKACLDCDRATSSKDSEDNEEFRKQLYEDIVLPLEQELDRGFGLTPENLHSEPKRP